MLALLTWLRPDREQLLTSLPGPAPMRALPDNDSDWSSGFE